MAAGSRAKRLRPGKHSLRTKQGRAGACVQRCARTRTRTLSGEKNTNSQQPSWCRLRFISPRQRPAQGSGSVTSSSGELWRLHGRPELKRCRRDAGALRGAARVRCGARSGG